MEATGQVDIVAALHTMEVDTEGVAMVEVDTEDAKRTAIRLSAVKDTESPTSWVSSFQES